MRSSQCKKEDRRAEKDGLTKTFRHTYRQLRNQDGSFETKTEEEEQIKVNWKSGQALDIMHRYDGELITPV